MNRRGFFFFLDLTYLEIDLGGKFYNFTYKESGLNLKERDNFFNFGLLFKYPFQISEKMQIFPLIGFDRQIFTKAKLLKGASGEVERSDLYKKNYFDKSVINLGLGLDYNIIAALFLRGEFIYGFNIHTDSQKDLIDEVKSYGYKLSILQHGPSFKLAIGYRFF
jgi:hypothetical protein